MVKRRGELDLAGAKEAFHGKKNIGMNFIIFFVGSAMLIVGSVIAAFSENLTVIFIGIWIGASGLFSMLYSIIKLIKSIFYF